jgi:hypothetical protein
MNEQPLEDENCPGDEFRCVELKILHKMTNKLSDVEESMIRYRVGKGRAIRVPT